MMTRPLASLYSTFGETTMQYYSSSAGEAVERAQLFSRSKRAASILYVDGERFILAHGEREVRIGKKSDS